MRLRSVACRALPGILAVALCGASAAGAASLGRVYSNGVAFFFGDALLPTAAVESLETVVPVPRAIDPDRDSTAVLDCLLRTFDLSDPVRNVKFAFETQLHLLDTENGTFETFRVRRGTARTGNDGSRAFQASIPTALFAEGFRSGRIQARAATRVRLLGSRKIASSSFVCDFSLARVAVVAADSDPLTTGEAAPHPLSTEITDASISYYPRHGFQSVELDEARAATRIPTFESVVAAPAFLKRAAQDSIPLECRFHAGMLSGPVRNLKFSHVTELIELDNVTGQFLVTQLHRGRSRSRSDGYGEFVLKLPAALFGEKLETGEVSSWLTTRASPIGAKPVLYSSLSCRLDALLVQ